MTKEETRIYNDIMQCFHFKDHSFSLAALNHREGYQAVAGMLDYVTKSAGCHGYVFVLSITRLEERYGEDLTPYLWEILDQYVTYPDICFSRDVAFAAFYNLCLHYARHFKNNVLKKLLATEVYVRYFFEDYPLYYEMGARYLGNSGKHDRQILVAKCAQKKFAELAAQPVEVRTYPFSGYVESGVNMGIKISFVAAICSYAEFLYVRSVSATHATREQANDADMDARTFNDFLNSPPYESSYYHLTDGDLDIAEEYVDAAIVYNETYPKYPYLKARIIFYRHVLAGLPLSNDTQNEIYALLERAKNLENSHADDYDLRVAQYALFYELVDNHCRGISKNKEIELKKRDILCKEECPPHEARPHANFSENGDYVFISYCSLDFKPVYVDLLEMKKRGIHFWYDRETIPGEKWYNVIPEALEKAACMVCYLSDDYMTRPAVQKELELAIKYQKPVICITMTGKPRISKSIISAIKNNAVEQISSQMMKTLVEVFDDDLDTIARSKDATVTSHINRLYDVLLKHFPKTISLGRGEGLTKANNSAVKLDYTRPNEDAFFAEENSKIYAIADGISRKKTEYQTYGGSIAKTLSESFVDCIGRRLVSKIGSCTNFSQAKNLLREQFKEVNEEMGQLLQERAHTYDQTAERPGCVCLVGIIFQDKFIFGSAGDCMGILIRDGQTMVFSQKQTTFAFEKLQIEKDRTLLYEQFVNKSDNEFGYGVVNGDENAVACFKISHIELKSGDVLYLATDGVSDYVQFARGDKMNKMSLEEIFAASDEQDRITNVKYSDDKTLVRIFVGD